MSNMPGLAPDLAPQDAKPAVPTLAVTRGLMRWLSQSEFERSILPFDLEPDLCEKGDLRLDLCLSFSHIVIPFEDLAQYEEWYIGYEGVRVEVQVIDGKVLEYTRTQVVPVNYSNTITRNRSAAVNLTPKIDAGEASVELGGINFIRGTDSSFVTELTCSERILSPTIFEQRGLVRWLFDRPKVKSALRDFLDGNLHLFVTCRWNGSGGVGTLHVRPTGIRVYDENRERMQAFRSPRKRLMVEFLLRTRENFRPADRGGRTEHFELRC